MKLGDFATKVRFFELCLRMGRRSDGVNHDHLKCSSLEVAVPID